MITKDLFRLDGEIAIVTGGEGQLGQQYVEALSCAGAKVVSVDMRTGKSGKTIVADITKKEDVKRAFDEIEKHIGTATILVNNAGADSPPNASAAENGPFEDYPEASWDTVIDSHLKGAFFMSQEFMRRYKDAGKKHGSIINVSSTYGVVTPDQSLYDFRRKNGETFYKPVAYSVAKSGMLNFTRWLAEYGSSWGIRANCLVLGGVANSQAEEFTKEYNKRTILGRMAQADEYNGAMIFLASHKASSYVTGAILANDGGWTAR